MKITLCLLISCTLAVFAHAQFTVTLTSTIGGGFDRSITTSIPTSGTYTENPLTEEIFQNLSGNNLGRAVYKVGHFNPTNANYWGALSQEVQTFVLDVSEITTIAKGSGPTNELGEAKIRAGRSNKNSGVNYTFQDWVDVVVGVNTLSIASTDFDKQVLFQLDGGVVLNSFSHSYGTDTDTITAVPEPSSYALLVGMGLIVFIARRRSR